MFSFKQVDFSPNQAIVKQYVTDFETLKVKAAHFYQIVSGYQKSNEGNEQLVRAYYEVRTAFKKVEFIWEYVDPIYVKEWVNGAPLPKLDKSAPQLVIIDPKGLQVIDELLFADELDLNELSKVTIELNKAIQDYPIQQKLSDRVILEGMRIELIRLFNLGLTGFDVPASNRALEDAQVVFAKIESTLSFYTEAVQQKNQVVSIACNEAIVKGKKQLNADVDFDSFDRLKFLIEVVNPLYKSIGQMQQLLEVESIYEVVPSSSKIALNYNATNLFASDFLNPFYYVNLPQKRYTPELVELGKYLFFDPLLSASNERSCASCHNPQKGFTDGLAKSVATGFNGTVDRNSPTLLNVVYSERFFHDLRADALEDQMEHVVASDKEFNTNIIAIMRKLSLSNEYQQRFNQLFADYPNPINQQTISFAISAYVSSLHSFNSPFDHFVRGEASNLTASAKRGFNLFMGKAACGTCHFAPNFNGTVPPLYIESESEVLGVLANPYDKVLILDKDEGRISAKLKEGAPFYRYSFKTPTIRNVALTAPYMHNGAYATIEDVIDFYNNGGGLGIGLAVPYQTLSSDSLHLTKQEKADLIEFMKALTDTTGLTSKPIVLPLVQGESLLNNRKVGGNY
ncbi:MAG: cytochrome-c peroxidase [Bacteroidia bacterium]|jgi:cytochrome c peroxidase|nr:cytochrome-c peroxidase [Bacteroidia bacterium]